MIGEFTTLLLEEVMTLLEGIHHISELSDGHTTHLFELANVVGKVRFLDVHGLVGTPGGNHLNFETTLASLLVVAKVVDGIVGGANALYTVVAHQSTSREFGLFEFLVTLVENLAGCGWRQQLVDAESSLQLKMCPVVKGIAKRVGHRLCPLLELLPIGGVGTSAVALVNTVGAHSTPLVVVTAKP